MRKDIDATTANAESIGMILFRKQGLQDMQNCLLEMVRIEDNLQLFYLAALRRMMQRGHRINFHEVDPEAWAEVDFHPDIEQMRNQLKLKVPRLS